VAGIRAHRAAEAVWLLEHPPLYTAGTSAKDADLRHAQFPVYQTGRGGQYTYHGPGQRIAYAMMDLHRRGGDIRRYVWQLEEVVTRALQRFAIQAERREGRIGLWVTAQGGTENKIAAIGVRVRSGVTYHGLSLNVNPDLTHYAGIVPCGISAYGVTSLSVLGVQATMRDVDTALIQAFEEVFTVPYAAIALSS
jgi:lipoyl(octanoyl) transferase